MIDAKEVNEEILQDAKIINQAVKYQKSKLDIMSKVVEKTNQYMEIQDKKETCRQAE